VSQPRAVIFDLDDTLMPEVDAVRAALADACAIAFPTSLSKSAVLCDSLRLHARDLWSRGSHAAYCRGIGFSYWEGLWGDATGSTLHGSFFRAWQPPYRAEAWRRALTDVGLDDASLARRVSEAFRAETRVRLLPFDGAAGVVRELRRAGAVGLLTNGESGIQREKLASAGFADMFDAVVVSGDIGFGKPSQAPFRHVLARLGVAASDSVMVGNSVRSDILGAQAVGMRAILVGSPGGPPAGVTPNATVADIRDVPAALRRLG
jgi:putative hydrolase of the HAD superfamily